MKGQSAVEYLTTYGWMLLMVAIVGASVLSIIRDKSEVRSVSGMANSDVQLDDFGITQDEGLKVELIGSNSDQIENVNFSVESDETGEKAYSCNRKTLPVGGTRKVNVAGIELSENPNTYTIVINYDSGELQNLTQKGSLTANLELNKSISCGDIGYGTGSESPNSDNKPFVIEVNSSNTHLGKTGEKRFELSTGDPSYSYDFNLNVNGSSTNSTEELINRDNDTIVEWSESGVYEVSVYGSIPHISYESNGDAPKIIDVTKWGSNKWQDTSKMFRDARNLETFSASDNPDLTKVTDMSDMFSGARNFNGEIGSWDTSNVEDMGGMFHASIYFNQDIGSWDTGNVKDMSNMFARATFFNQSIGSWDTGNVEDMGWMFYKATSFNQSIGSWNTSRVKDMEKMFEIAWDFNQDISSWNTSNVSDMESMFDDAVSFNKNISKWCVDQLSSKPDNFDIDSGFEGKNELQPEWGTTAGCSKAN